MQRSSGSYADPLHLPLYTEVPQQWPTYVCPEAQATAPMAYMAPAQVLAIGAQAEYPQCQIRAISTEGTGNPPAPQALQPTIMNPLLLGLPVDKPEAFTGNRRDWRRFSRQFDKYDRDILSMGVISEAARIRVLAGLLDKAGKMKLETLQRQAQL